jgi:glucose 1-dehydrogenase
MGLLQNKVIVITGGTRGFGLAAARACATEGATVVVSSRSVDATAQAVEALRANGAAASGIACDMGDMTQVEALSAHALEKYGCFDVWVNNAGYAPPFGPTAHVPSALIERAIQTNILGAYHGSIVALRHFLPRGHGKLINILGRGDDGKPAPMQNGYGSTKSWLRSFTLTLAKEYKDSGVGIYAFNPGMMSTEFLTDLTAISGYEARLEVMPMIVRMWSKPPDVPATKVVWLASNATDGKTGLELREMNMGTMIGGALREGWRRLMGEPEPENTVKVSLLPAAMPLLSRKR